jgi:hydrogenase-4 component F
MTGTPVLPGLAILLPLLAAGGAALAPSAEVAAWLAIGGATAAFALAAALPWLPWLPDAGRGLLSDPLAVHMAVLTAFVAMTGAWFARPFWRLEQAAGRADAGTARRGHALQSALLAALLVALLANHPLLAWAGMAASVLLLVAALRLTGAETAAWRLFLAGGAGLALALLGTLLLELAASPVLGPGAHVLRWTFLAQVAPQGHGPLMTLAFVFLLLGYGTLAGLVPLHGALAAAAEGPAPLTGVLSGLLPGVALVTILRARALLAANPDALPPGPALMALGLLSLLLASLALRREGDPKTFLAVACTGQVGVVAFAFGLGSGATIFAGMLHLTLLTLVRAALAQGLARAEQLKGPALGGLLAKHRALGLTLAAGLVALAGVPPFGLFTSGFLIVLETTRKTPLLAIPLGLGLAACAWALAARAMALCRQPPMPEIGPAPPPAALLPAWLHFSVVLLLGLAMPAATVEWFARIAEAMR